MSRTSETPRAPRLALIDLLDSGQTGCLTSHSDAVVQYRVYVMLGEVLAAQSDLDDERMLGILRAAGHVDEARHQVLRAGMLSGNGLSEALFDVLPEDLLMELFFERFRENLFQFLADDLVPEFVEMEAVFVENIQVGHDTRILLEALDALEARIGKLAGEQDMILGPGRALPATGVERSLVARCTPSCTLAELVVTSPWESTRLLDVICVMLDEQKLVTGQLIHDEELHPDEDTADAMAPGNSGPSALAAARAPRAPAPLHAEPSDEDELAAFGDYDTVREAGSFLTEAALLDRVELDQAPVQLVASTETLIEMEEAEDKDLLKSAVSLNFSGPKLLDGEIQRKLDVTNDVLATISAAIEAVDGRGAGPARIQLLIEGTSVPLAPLFKGIEVAADGRLPVAHVTKNLRKRPAGEHRRLLNRALSDLIDRALSAADESLDVDGFETMLTQLAGYQQRLGV